MSLTHLTHNIFTQDELKMMLILLEHHEGAVEDHFDNGDQRLEEIIGKVRGMILPIKRDKRFHFTAHFFMGRTIHDHCDAVDVMEASNIARRRYPAARPTEGRLLHRFLHPVHWHE